MAFAASCKKADKNPVIGTAAAGPMELNLREEISPASKTVAVAKHGEHLEILQIRRRFVRVRTPSGEIGWTDSGSLLSAQQMNDLAALSKRAAEYPSQGEATVYAALNVHAEPFRSSTSFYQLTEGVRLDVLAHRVSPRTGGGKPASNNLDLKKAPPPRPRKKKKEPEYPPPPRGAAPGLPSNWIALSITPEIEAPKPPPPSPEEIKKSRRRRRVRKPKPDGPPMESWSLIRTKDGKAGWVLSRMLVMTIPDEVAQWSEGARITSYRMLGTVEDEGQTKHHWLWTTSRDDSAPYEFDSFRIFTYVVRKHRYETAYIERDVEGYYPTEATPGKMPRFSLILREADGKLYKKTWLMEGYIVRKVSEEPYEKPEGDVIGPEEKELSLSERLRSLLNP